MAAALVVIPVRLDSTRLVRKALAPIAGLSLIRRVVRQALAANVGPVIVATDSPLVAAEVEVDVQVVRTGAAENGTLRVALAAHERSEGVILNVQGDQPLLDPEHLVVLARRMRTASIGTIVTAYRGDPQDRSLVEAVLEGDSVVDFRRSPVGPPRWRHLGLYGFTRSALHQVTQLPISARARAVGLEQLTWLDAGLEIRVATVGHAETAVDTPEQLESVRQTLGG